MMDFRKVERDKGEMQVDKVDKQVVTHSTFSLLRWISSESRRRMVGSSLRQKKHLLETKSGNSQLWQFL